MLGSLKQFGFGNSFIRWIHTMYSGIGSCVLNNGWISAPCTVQRGIRQGCPLSALIFVIAVEILAIKIRTNDDIGGFEIRIDTEKHNIFKNQNRCN